VSEDLAFAAVWYRKASAQGHEDARQALAALEANWKAEAEALTVGSKLRRVFGVPTSHVASADVRALLEKASPPVTPVTVTATAPAAAAAAAAAAATTALVEGASDSDGAAKNGELDNLGTAPDDELHCASLAAAATCFLFGYGVAMDVAAAKALFALVDVSALKTLASQAPSNGGYKTAVATAAANSSSSSNSASTDAAVEAAVAGAEMQRYAQFLLGGMLLAGHGAADEEDEEAVEWLERASQAPKHQAYVDVSWHPRGLAHAQYSLGSCHYYGLGVEFEDDQLAVQLYTKAAEQGHGDARYFLGILEEPQPDPTSHLPPPPPPAPVLASNASKLPPLAPSLAGIELHFPACGAAAISVSSDRSIAAPRTSNTDLKRLTAEARIDGLLQCLHESNKDAQGGVMEEEVKDSEGSAEELSSKLKGQARAATGKTAESPPRKASSTTPQRRSSHDRNSNSSSNNHSNSVCDAGARAQGSEPVESRGRHTPPRKPTKASPALRRNGSGSSMHTAWK